MTKTLKMTYYLRHISPGNRRLQLMLLILYSIEYSTQLSKSENDSPVNKPPFGYLKTSRDVSLSSRASLDLQCPPCDRIHCTPKRPGHLKCKGGVTKGVCNCCPVCARIEGETCGGQWNYLGRCDAGLHCELHSNHVINDWIVPSPGVYDKSYRYSDTGNKYSERYAESSYEGVCRKVYELSDDPRNVPEQCLPKCTYKFCQLNPKQLCSASENAERPQTCQGECQHTSCSACKLIKREDPVDCSASRCRKDDMVCLRSFGRCMRKMWCSRNEYPCRAGEEETGSTKFRCMVPECWTSFSTFSRRTLV